MSTAAHSIGGRQYWDQLAVDALVRIWEKWGNPELREKFKTKRGYIYVTVRNVFRDFLKARNSLIAREQELPESGDVWPGSLWDEPHWEVTLALQRLDQAEVELVFLHYYLKMNITDIAREWCTPRNRVDRLHAKALQHLKALLEVKEEEEG